MYVYVNVCGFVEHNTTGACCLLCPVTVAGIVYDNSFAAGRHNDKNNYAQGVVTVGKHTQVFVFNQTHRSIYTDSENMQSNAMSKHKQTIKNTCTHTCNKGGLI